MESFTQALDYLAKGYTMYTNITNFLNPPKQLTAEQVRNIVREEVTSVFNKIIEDGKIDTYTMVVGRAFDFIFREYKNLVKAFQEVLDDPKSNPDHINHERTSVFNLLETSHRSGFIDDLYKHKRAIENEIQDISNVNSQQLLDLYLAINILTIWLDIERSTYQSSFEDINADIHNSIDDAKNCVEKAQHMLNEIQKKRIESIGGTTLWDNTSSEYLGSENGTPLYDRRKGWEGYYVKDTWIDEDNIDPLFKAGRDVNRSGNIDEVKNSVHTVSEYYKSLVSPVIPDDKTDIHDSDGKVKPEFDRDGKSIVADLRYLMDTNYGGYFHLEDGNRRERFNSAITKGLAFRAWVVDISNVIKTIKKYYETVPTAEITRVDGHKTDICGSHAILGEKWNKKIKSINVKSGSFKLFEKEYFKGDIADTLLIGNHNLPEGMEVYSLKADVEEKRLYSNKLLAGEKLKPGQSLLSPLGIYRLTYESDGEVSFYDNSGRLRSTWGLTLKGKYSAGELVMQTDGNLVCYDKSGKYYWGSGTSGNNYIEVFDSGGVAMLSKEKVKGMIWRSPQEVA